MLEMKFLFFVFAFFAAVTFAEELNRRNTWAVLVAGDSGWSSYAVQSSMYKMYQVLRKAGIPKKNIITFFGDDIAYHQKNPFPGVVLNEIYVKGGINNNVYKGISKDYIGRAASPDNFVKVLTGVATGSGKTLASTAQDNVFVFYVGTGDYYTRGNILLPGGTLRDKDLSGIFWQMYTKKMYNKLFFFLDADYAADMFNNLEIPLSRYSNVYVLASASHYDHSTNCLFDQNVGTKVTRCWSHALTNLLETKGLNITVENLYRQVYGQLGLDPRQGGRSCQFGDSIAKNMTFSEFISNTNSLPSRGVPFCGKMACNKNACPCFSSCMLKGYAEDRCKYFCCDDTCCFR